jgi:glucosyl-dolichyl phosphate glucuronosyltransferase
MADLLWELGMHISVIICTWNRSYALSKTLASIDDSVVPSGIEWEVLVVDNNSTDNTRAVCQSFMQRAPRRFRYFFEQQQGKSFALNLGIRQSQGDILAFTDDDVTVHPHWLHQIYEAFQKYGCAGIAGKIVAVWTCKQPSWIDLDGPYHHDALGGIVRFDKGNVPLALDCTAAGANLAFKKSVFEKHGTFRVDLSGNHADSRRAGNLLGGEDTELCRRILNAGEKLIYIPQAIVYHPVEKHRVDKKYLTRFAFNYGRFMTRLSGVPDGAKCYFGIPRYMFPVALKFFANWITSFDAKRRFYYRLQFSSMLGQMKEGRQWVQVRQAEHAVQELDSAR